MRYGCKWQVANACERKRDLSNGIWPIVANEEPGARNGKRSQAATRQGRIRLAEAGADLPLDVPKQRVRPDGLRRPALREVRQVAAHPVGRPAGVRREEHRPAIRVIADPVLCWWRATG